MKAALLALLLAYIPSAGSLLKRAAARVSFGGKSKEVALNGTLTLAGETPRPASLVLHFPLECKLDQTFEVKGTVEKPVGDAGTTPLQHLLALVCPFIAYRGLPAADAENALRAAATAEGADLAAATTLTRFQDRVAYVLGGKAQLWLYKDSNAPARVLAANGADLRLLQYGNPVSAVWFPRVMELYEEGKLAARFEVLETQGMKPLEEEEDERGE